MPAPSSRVKTGRAALSAVVDAGSSTPWLRSRGCRVQHRRAAGPQRGHPLGRVRGCGWRCSRRDPRGRSRAMPAAPGRRARCWGMPISALLASRMSRMCRCPAARYNASSRARAVGHVAAGDTTSRSRAWPQVGDHRPAGPPGQAETVLPIVGVGLPTRSIRCSGRVLRQMEAPRRDLGRVAVVRPSTAPSPPRAARPAAYGWDGRSAHPSLNTGTISDDQVGVERVGEARVAERNPGPSC